jgi:hypothetical protein
MITMINQISIIPKVQDKKAYKKAWTPFKNNKVLLNQIFKLLSISPIKVENNQEMKASLKKSIQLKKKI